MESGRLRIDRATGLSPARCCARSGSCRPPGRWLNGSLDINCRSGSDLTGASLPSAMLRASVRLRRSSHSRAEGYYPSSAFGGLSRRCRWLGWIAEGNTYSTHAHRCCNQFASQHRSSAMRRTFPSLSLVGVDCRGQYVFNTRPSLLQPVCKPASLVRLRRTFPENSLVGRWHAGLIAFKKNSACCSFYAVPLTWDSLLPAETSWSPACTCRPFT